MGIFKILKNKASRSIFWISAIKKMAKILHFCEFFHFYLTLDYHKIRTRTNFENPNGKSLDLHLIMWFTLKQLFPGSTDFTEAIFKIRQISKHFSAMLLALWLSRVPKWSVCTHTYKGLANSAQQITESHAGIFYETEIIEIACLKIIHKQGLLKKWKKALNCFVAAASIFILLSEQKHIINMLLSKKYLSQLK